MFISLLWTCAAGRVGSQASHCLDPEQRGYSLQKHQKTAGMFQEEGGAQAPKAPLLPTPLLRSVSQIDIVALIIIGAHSINLFLKNESRFSCSGKCNITVTRIK